MNNKRFINAYEKEIKDYRDEYYKNIILNNNKTTPTYPVVTFLVPLIISLVLLLASEFTILGYIVSFAALIIINLLIYFLFTSRIEKNNYLEAIRRNGYRSIEDYEKKLREIITGPTGYYNNLLLDLIEKHNINSSTKKVQTIKNEEYYFWSSKNKDKIYLLNTYCNQKPEVKIIPISNVRYFRVDPNTQNVIFKTNNDLFIFKPEAITYINEILKEKRLENIKTFEPAIYIDDYEIYMHKIKKNLEKDTSKKKEKHDTSLNNAIYLTIAIALIIVISIVLTQVATIANIFNCVLIILLNLSINGVLKNKVKVSFKAETELIKELNNNPEYIEVFKELKYVLGIKDTYDKVYTKEGAEYITWVTNGYFHVFLNLIYFNSVYMAVKTSDVKYFKEDYNSCDLKLKDKTLEFTKESKYVFTKILPNKDYEWIKNSQKN